MDDECLAPLYNDLFVYCQTLITHAFPVPSNVHYMLMDVPLMYVNQKL